MTDSGRRTVFNRLFQPDPAGWTQLVPAPGEYPGMLLKDGEPAEPVVQVVDGDAYRRIAAAFKTDKGAENWPGLLIDFDHFSHDVDKPSRAAGWMDELEVRPDEGIFVRGRWTAAGKEAIEGGDYRGASPVFDVEILEDGRVRPIRLSDGGLTNQPAIKGMVPVSNRAGKEGAETQNTGGTQMLEKLRALFGKPDATEDEMLSSVQTAVNRSRELDQVKTDAAGKTAELEQTKNRVAELEREQLQAEAEKFVDEHAGVIANREAAIAQYVQNKDATVALFGTIKDASAIKSEPGEKKTLNRGDGKTPDGSPAGEDEATKEAEAQARRIRNRALELQAGNKSRKWSECFAQARSEVEA